MPPGRCVLNVFAVVPDFYPVAYGEKQQDAASDQKFVVVPEVIEGSAAQGQKDSRKKLNVNQPAQESRFAADFPLLIEQGGFLCEDDGHGAVRVSQNLGLKLLLPAPAQQVQS